VSMSLFASLRPPLGGRTRLVDINFFCLHPSLYLSVSWAWWDWPLTWLTDHHPSVLRHCWLGHVTLKIVSEMTYNVASGMLNPTIAIPHFYVHQMNWVNSHNDTVSSPFWRKYCQWHQNPKFCASNNLFDLQYLKKDK